MRKLLTVLILLVAVLVAAGVWFTLYATYSDGYRVGQVIKLSHKGYLFKTWEGTLDFGYLQTDPQGGVATRIWDFSVDPGDHTVLRDIDAAIARNDKVKLFYREKYVRLFWRGDTRHFVYKVEKAGGAGDTLSPPVLQAPAPSSAAPPASSSPPASPAPGAPARPQ